MNFDSLSLSKGIDLPRLYYPIPESVEGSEFNSNSNNKIKQIHSLRQAQGPMVHFNFKEDDPSTGSGSLQKFKLF